MNKETAIEIIRQFASVFESKKEFEWLVKAMNFIDKLVEDQQKEIEELKAKVKYYEDIITKQGAEEKYKNLYLQIEKIAKEQQKQIKELLDNKKEIEEYKKEIEEYQKCFEDIERHQKNQMQMQKELWKRLKGEINE